MLIGYFRNAGIIAAIGVVVRLKPLILVPLLTRAYGPAGYGLWAQVAVLVGMMTPLLMLSIDAAALRFLPGQPRERIERAFATLTWYSLFVSGVAAALLWLLAAPVSGAMFDGPANAGYVPLCGAVIAGSLLLNVARNYHRAIGRAAGFAALNLVEALLTLGVCAIVIWREGTLLEVVLYSSLVDIGLAALVIWRSLGAALRAFDTEMLRGFVRFGLPLVPAGYGMWALNQVDRLFITHYTGLEALGVYSVAFSIGAVLVQFLVQPVWMMFPSAAAELHNRGDAGGVRRLHLHVTRAVLGLVIPAVFAMTVLGAPMVRLFATEAFVSGAPVVPLIACAYLFLSLSAYYDVGLALCGRQGRTTINLGMAAAVNIAANAALVPVLGIAGAALACVIGFGTYVVLAWRTGARDLGLALDWRFAGKALAAAAAMTAVLYLLSPQTPRDLPLAVAVGAACYGALLLLMRAVTRDEWSALLRAAGIHRQPGLYRRLGGGPGAGDVT